MHRALGHDTFTILRAPLVSDPIDGGQYRDWANPTEIVVTGANVQPFPMAEKLNFEMNLDREFARTAVRIYSPPNTRFEATDRIIYEGRTYEVFGHQGFWHRLVGGHEVYVQVIARLLEG